MTPDLLLTVVFLGLAMIGAMIGAARPKAAPARAIARRSPRA